ncbi:MAG: creatininase family protein, partial [Gemmatimonadales bacterium]
LDTSLLLYIAPDLVRMEAALDFEASRRDAARFRKRSRLPAGSEGSVGYPRVASAQKGEQVYKLILERIAERCFDFVHRDPDTT